MIGKSIRAALFVLLAALGLAHAGIIINPYIIASAGASIVDGPTGPPVAATYGADPDGGEVDDPTLSATFSLGSVYYAGTIVNNGAGVYYYALKSNTNAPLANTTYWRQISNVYYFDSAGSDANSTCNSTGTTNPATAKASPCQTMQRAADLLDGSGSSPNTVNAPVKSLILFKRGQTWDGHLFVQQGTSAEYIIGAWGTGARPLIRYAISGGVQVDGDSTIKAGPGATAGGLIVRNVTIDAQFIVDYKYTAGVGTFAPGDVITQTADGLKQGTIQEVRTFSGNTYISVVHTSHSDIMSNAVAFQTSGGAKTGTTVGSGYSMSAMLSQKPNWSIWNFTIQNTISNGLAGGYYGDNATAVNIIAYNGTVQDSGLSGGAGAGTDIQYGNNVKVLHVTLKDNGANATFAHNLYYDDINNLEIGWLWSYMTRGDRGNHCIVLHGTMDSGWIHDSLLDGCQNGIGINDGYHGTNFNGSENFSNFIVERVIIRNMGQYAGPGLTLDLAGVTNSVFRNILAYNNGYPVSYKDRNQTGTNPTVPSANNSFICNTFVAPATGTLPMVKIIGSPSLGATTFTNNIIETKSATTTVYPFQWDGSGTAPTMTYNNIYNPNFTGTINWNGSTYTVATAPAGTGTNSNTTAAAPTFVNEAGGNYAVSGSPKTLGTPLANCTTDITGATRSGTTPTIGAYE